MKYTEHLYRDLDAAQDEIDAIKAAGQSLYKRLAVDLASFAGAYKVDVQGALDHLDDAITEMVNDATEDAEERKREANNAIEALDYDDLMLSRVP